MSKKYSSLVDCQIKANCLESYYQAIDMRTSSQNLEILNVICKHYDFIVSTRKLALGYVLKIRNIYPVNLMNDRGMIFSDPLTIGELVDILLSYVTQFSVYNDKDNRCHRIKNIFIGCKTLEEVLIAKDLDSHKV